jgi:hypothetical protein
MSSVSAFANVDVEKDTYKLGDEVKVTTDSYDYIQIVDASGTIIHEGTSDKDSDGRYNFDFTLPTSSTYQNSGKFVVGGTYTVIANGANGLSSDKFTISGTTLTSKKVTPSVTSRAYIGWNKNMVSFDADGFSSSDTVSITYTLYDSSNSELSLDDDYDARYDSDSSITNTIKNVSINTLKNAQFDLYFRKSGTYTIYFTIKDSDGNIVNESTKGYSIRVYNTSSSSSGSSGGSSSGSGSTYSNSTWIPGITSANTASGINVQLNPSQETESGITRTVAYSAAYTSTSSFTVGVTLDGVATTNFTGYDPVYVTVPYTANLTDTTTLVVKDAFGNIIPRSLYSGSNMLVNLKDLSSTYTIVNNPVSFDDVTHPWAVTSINALAARGIVSGVGDNLYDPDRAVTRAEFTKMIVSMFDVYDSSAVAQFADIDNTEWYAPYVGTAQKLAITNGYAEDNTFRPNQIISREEMSAMLFRAAEVLSVDVTASISKTEFSDDASIQEYAKVPVYQMQQAEVLQGVGNNTFDPQGTCTRAQAAVAIYNMFVLSMNK